MELLSICAQWHALAKLKLHNDYTLDLLDYTTTQLGSQMRRFERDTCMVVPTKETKREAQIRAKRDGSSSQRAKKLGIYTIKFHFLGDYTAVIRKLGTTDSYSTQTVSDPVTLIPHEVSQPARPIGGVISQGTQVLVPPNRPKRL
jgi:hypothetical protein